MNLVRSKWSVCSFILYLNFKFQKFCYVKSLPVWNHTNTKTWWGIKFSYIVIWISWQAHETAISCTTMTESVEIKDTKKGNHCQKQLSTKQFAASHCRGTCRTSTHSANVHTAMFSSSQSQSASQLAELFMCRMCWLCFCFHIPRLVPLREMSRVRHVSSIHVYFHPGSKNMVENFCKILHWFCLFFFIFIIQQRINSIRRVTKTAFPPNR